MKSFFLFFRRSGSTNVVKYLVEEEHCLMEHGDDGGRLPLHYAAG